MAQDICTTLNEYAVWPYTTTCATCSDAVLISEVARAEWAKEIGYLEKENKEDTSIL